MQPPQEEAHRDSAGDTQWSRPECQAWTGTLLLGTCLLYCARASMPICTVSMSQDFGWNKKEAGIVLSSFFWGYCLTQVVGGHLGDRIGGEKVILLSASAWGSITAVTPLLAHLGSAHLAFMTFSRILMGLLQGVYFPALTSLLSRKVRESERAFTYSTVGAGSQFGTLLTGAVGSLLLEWYSWQSVFYFSGSLTLLWVWYVYRYLLSEKDLVPASGVLAPGLLVSRHNRVPWRRLFQKPAVWAAVFSQLSAACSFFVLLSWLPTFFKETFPDAKVSRAGGSHRVECPEDMRLELPQVPRVLGLQMGVTLGSSWTLTVLAPPGSSSGEHPVRARGRCPCLNLKIMWVLHAFLLLLRLQPFQLATVTCWPAEPDFRARRGLRRSRDVDRGVTCCQHGSSSKAVLLPSQAVVDSRAAQAQGWGRPCQRAFLGSGGHGGCPA
ncbi:voltage-gated purine nucleotide uniporter SLC17A9 isoform X3 [Callithrix jacchus]